MSHLNRKELINLLHPQTKVYTKDLSERSSWVFLERAKEDEFLLPGEDGCPCFPFAWKEEDHGFLFLKEFNSFIKVICVRVLDQRWVFFAGEEGQFTFAFPPYKVGVIRASH